MSVTVGEAQTLDASKPVPRGRVNTRHLRAATAASASVFVAAGVAAAPAGAHNPNYSEYCMEHAGPNGGCNYVYREYIFGSSGMTGYYRYGPTWGNQNSFICISRMNGTGDRCGEVVIHFASSSGRPHVWNDANRYQNAGGNWVFGYAAH
jgi:hypothetical protein